MTQGKKTNNWLLLKKTIPKKQEKNNKNVLSSLTIFKKHDDFQRMNSNVSTTNTTDSTIPITFSSLICSNKTIETKMRKLSVAIDCEMVGVGKNLKII